MPSSVTTIATWILRLIVAAFFLYMGAYMKLTGNPGMVEEFGKLGLGPYFIYVAGAIELVGALLVLYPKTTPLGCLLLLCVMIGAFVAQIGPLHGDVIHVLVAALVLGVLYFLTRRHMTAMMSGGGTA